MIKRTLRSFSVMLRRSQWMLALIALVPNLVISLAITYQDREGPLGFLASFIAIEGLVILLLWAARPLNRFALLAEELEVVEARTAGTRLFLGRIRADVPNRSSGLTDPQWEKGVSDVRDGLHDLLSAVNDGLRPATVDREQLQLIADTLSIATSQVRAARPFDMQSLKRAACYLGCHAARNVTKVYAVNRISPALWFSPEMSVYFLDLYRSWQEHRVPVEYKRITILREADLEKINDLRWRTDLELDPLKGFVSLNQTAGIEFMTVLERDFQKRSSEFLRKNGNRIETLDRHRQAETRDLIRNLAVLVFCENDRPVAAFSGRRFGETESDTPGSSSKIQFPEIQVPIQRELLYQLVLELEGLASTAPLVESGRPCTCAESAAR